MAAPRWWPTPTWKAPTARSTRTSARTRRGCSGCSSSSRFPAASPAMPRRSVRARIHEGGELGYSLSHAFGAVFDNPGLIVACVVGDGEAETGPLATAWHSNKFLNPVSDGAVLPILHLNGYKIANPTVLARIAPRGTGAAAARLRLDAIFRRGQRARGDAPGDGRDAGCGGGADPADPARCARGRRPHAAALADDRARFAQGLDRAEAGRRPAERGHLPRAPGAAVGLRQQPAGTPAAARGVAAQLPAARAVRCRWPAAAGAGRARAHRHAPHGREPACQRRPAAARPAPAGLPRLRGRGAAARRARDRRHARAGAVPARRDPVERAVAQLPPLRSGRDGIERPRRSVRGHQSPVGGRHCSRTTSSLRRRAA